MYSLYKKGVTLLNHEWAGEAFPPVDDTWQGSFCSEGKSIKVTSVVPFQIEKEKGGYKIRNSHIHFKLILLIKQQGKLKKMQSLIQNWDSFSF